MTKREQFLRWIFGAFGVLFTGLFILVGPPERVRANVPCAIPFNLQNNTTADATQVMANYNAILTCLGNAAIAGANNDITQLLALTTPISPTQGGTTFFTGATSGGAANAQTITVTPNGFGLTSGYRIGFFAGFANTDLTTINVNGAGAKNLFRRTQVGVVAAVGGELNVGQWAEMVYDGTQFQLLSSTPTLVGEMVDYTAGGTPPVGLLFVDGSCWSRTGITATLFSVIGTGYDPTGSTCDGTHFAIPDLRGRVAAYQDSMGINGAANRITNAGSGCNGAHVGGPGCGAENVTLQVGQIPSGLFTFNAATHTHTFTSAYRATTFAAGAGGTALTWQGNGGNAGTTDPAATGDSITDHGSGQAHAVLNPLQVVLKAIRY